ncbi:hypothetical protein RhiirC2_773808 [Rhizophagus irregularis]|uniref:Uncharacterized protein n=1 Tax=Rhizophagus irregularis TaxID=588596 RepID=A0A2N1NMY7_9GLOM|nr:hypothetical protein RhiirC2_773808 [Rhizophagus irregularis]
MSIIELDELKQIIAEKIRVNDHNSLCDVTNDLVINNGSIQNIEEIKDGELIFAELETYLYEAKKIGIEQHQAKN